MDFRRAERPNHFEEYPYGRGKYRQFGPGRFQSALRPRIGGGLRPGGR